MRSEGWFIGLARKAGSLLSMLFVIFTLVLSPITVAGAHDAPHQTTSVTTVAQSQIPVNCHRYASCSVYVVPSNMSHLAAEALHCLRFLRSEAILLTGLNPVFDTPPPRV